MSRRSWAIVCLCLGMSLAGIGCGGSAMSGSVVDGTGNGTEKISDGDKTSSEAGDTDIAPPPSAEVCNDGVDNDGNGVTDCADVACASDTACAPAAAVEVCNDGLDNDGNGVTDCADVACASDLACNPVQDGDGSTPQLQAQVDWQKARVYQAYDWTKQFGPAPVCNDCPEPFEDWKKYINPADKQERESDGYMKQISDPAHTPTAGRDFGIRDRDSVTKKAAVIGQKDFGIDKEFNY